MRFDESYNNSITIKNKILNIPPIGFHNTGAICYFNSLIQCLLSSKNFIKFLIDDKCDTIFTEFFENITNDIWDMVFTTKILQKYNIIQANQSSSEYFMFLIDLLKLEDIFECNHKIISKCLNCGFTKEDKDISYCTLINNNIREFFEYEEQVDNVICDNCKIKSTKNRRKIIYGIPPIIVLSFNKYFGKKMIDYPMTFRNDEVEYRLVGTVEHFGMLGAGHYTARVMRDDKLYLANDSRINEIRDFSSKDETYMVFYERVK
jgi:ubiquitin C-terminal hydrolase